MDPLSKMRAAVSSVRAKALKKIGPGVEVSKPEIKPAASEGFDTHKIKTADGDVQPQDYSKINENEDHADLSALDDDDSKHYRLADR